MAATSRGSENGEADEGEGENARSGRGGGEDVSGQRKPLPPLRRFFADSTLNRIAIHNRDPNICKLLLVYYI
jgi:hypothetical protein